jgi:hypothetical protein
LSTTRTKFAGSSSGADVEWVDAPAFVIEGIKPAIVPAATTETNAPSAFRVMRDLLRRDVRDHAFRKVKER